MTVIGPVPRSPPPTAPTASSGAERRSEAGSPLAQQLDGGDNDERADAEAGDGAECDDGFAGAGGQHDDAASVGAQPGVHGGDLIGSGSEVEGWREGEGRSGQIGGT